MANTNTLTTLFGTGSDKRIIRSINIISDGTEETDLLVYDNSAFVADTSKGRVTKVWVSGSFTGAVRLEWDATADDHILSVGSGGLGCFDFTHFGGIKNPGSSGATGDILLTTTALANLDEVTVIIEIDQS